MLKASMKGRQASGTSTYLRDFVVLEEGETLSSIRKPEQRKRALKLLDKIKDEYENHCSKPRLNCSWSTRQTTTLTPRFNSLTNWLFRLLMNEFLPTRPPEEREMVEEIGRLLRYEDTIDIDTCYNSTFCVYVIRKALKDYKLPVIQAKLWKAFATNYTGLVMAA